MSRTVLDLVATQLLIACPHSVLDVMSSSPTTDQRAFSIRLECSGTWICIDSCVPPADVCCSELCTLERAAWWAVQQGARAVAAARLRTPLGNPTQTFAALEAALLRALPALEQGLPQSEPCAFCCRVPKAITWSTYLEAGCGRACCT